MTSPGNEPVGDSKIIKSDLYNPKDIKQKIAKDEYLKGSISFIVIAAFLLSFLISLAGYITHKFKTKRTQPFINIDDDPIIYDDRILLDFDITSFEENSQIS